MTMDPGWGTRISYGGHLPPAGAGADQTSSRKFDAVTPAGELNTGGV